MFRFCQTSMTQPHSSPHRDSAGVAQLVERKALNLVVKGSSPFFGGIFCLQCIPCLILRSIHMASGCILDKNRLYGIHASGSLMHSIASCTHLGFSWSKVLIWIWGHSSVLSAINIPIFCTVAFLCRGHACGCGSCHRHMYRHCCREAGNHQNGRAACRALHN